MDILIKLIEFTPVYIIGIGYVVVISSTLYCVVQFLVWIAERLRRNGIILKYVSEYIYYRRFFKPWFERNIGNTVDEIEDLPKCRCNDVNQCDTWCRAKAKFTRDHQ